MKIKDVFEIKEAHQTGHEPGLVVVLDTLIAQDPRDLAGRMASIQTQAKGIFELPIDEAKEHGAVNSLFFRGLVLGDIPVGSEIAVKQAGAAATRPSRSIAS